MVAMSPEEAALRRQLDLQLGRIDCLLGRIPPLEPADDDELAVAGDLANRVVEELCALEETARSLRMLVDCTVHAVELSASCGLAIEVARAAVSMVRAQVDSAAA